MQIKEIIVLTRPSIDVSFHPVEATGYFETDPTTSKGYKYFIENYVKSGKAIAVENRPLLSTDGLTITYETIFTSVEALEESYTDAFYDINQTVIPEWRKQNNILVTLDLIPME